MPHMTSALHDVASAARLRCQPSDLLGIPPVHLTKSEPGEVLGPVLLRCAAPAGGFGKRDLLGNMFIQRCCNESQNFA